MSDFPFTEKRIGEKLFLREFKENVDSEELVWHQDQEDRIVKVIQSNGWKLQMDNQTLPESAGNICTKVFMCSTGPVACLSAIFFLSALMP